MGNGTGSSENWERVIRKMDLGHQKIGRRASGKWIWVIGKMVGFIKETGSGLSGENAQLKKGKWLRFIEGKDVSFIEGKG